MTHIIRRRRLCRERETNEQRFLTPVVWVPGTCIQRDDSGGEKEKIQKEGEGVGEEVQTAGSV